MNAMFLGKLESLRRCVSRIRENRPASVATGVWHLEV